MSGPARKPTALKIMDGTVRKDRTNPREPVAELLGSAAPAPNWLAGRSARLGWKEVVPVLAGVRVATVADRVAIAMLCDAFGRWLDARRALAARGATTYQTTTESGSVMHREFPEVGQVERAWKQAVDALKEFGLTAAARPKVEATRPGEARPSADDRTEFEKWMDVG